MTSYEPASGVNLTLGRRRPDAAPEIIILKWRPASDAIVFTKEQAYELMANFHRLLEEIP